MIRTIIFDIGNVLAGFHWETYLRELGYEEERVQRIGQATVYQILWRELDRSETLKEELILQFEHFDLEIREDIRKYILGSAMTVREYDYALCLVETLKQAGYKVYLLSNYNGENYQYAMEHFSFIPSVDGAVISYEVGAVKPEKEIYQALIEKYKINPKEAVFLDDLEINVDGAKEQGFQGIVFRNLDQCLDDFKKLGVNISLA